MDWSPVLTSVVVAASTLGAVWLQNHHNHGGEKERRKANADRELQAQRQVAYLSFINLITLLPHKSVEHIEAGAKDLGAREIVKQVLEQLNVLKLIASPQVATDAEKLWHAFVFAMSEAEKLADKSSTGEVNSGSYIAHLTTLLKPPIDELAATMRVDLVADDSQDN